MDFEWIAIALGDVSWITLAFILGLAVRLINLPPVSWLFSNWLCAELPWLFKRRSVTKTG